MTLYVPILKGKPGEFTAWQNADERVLARTRPVFEAVPSKGADVDLAKFVSDATSRWPAGHTLTYDTSAMDQEAVRGTRAVRKVVLPGQRLFLSLGAGRMRWDESRSSGSPPL
jgi:hypothetical protein